MHVHSHHLEMVEHLPLRPRGTAHQKQFSPNPMNRVQGLLIGLIEEFV